MTNEANRIQDLERELAMLKLTVASATYKKGVATKSKSAPFDAAAFSKHIIKEINEKIVPSLKALDKRTNALRQEIEELKRKGEAQ